MAEVKNGTDEVRTQESEAASAAEKRAALAGAKRVAAYLNILKARVCWCGQPKVMRTAFCGTCWARLRGEMQRALYQRIGAGFEAAYEAAETFLRGEGGQAEACPTKRPAYERGE